MTPELLQKLKAHYKDGFPNDSDTFVEHFFANMLHKIPVYITLPDNSIAAAGYIVKKQAMILGAKTIAYYLSAISVKNNLRGKGYGSKIIEKLFEKVQELKAPVCFLNPFDSKFYTKYGFENFTFCGTSKIIGGKDYIYKKKYSNLPPDIILEKLVKIQSDYSSKFNNHIVYDKAALKEKLNNELLDGAKLYIFYDFKKNIAAYAACKDNKIYHYAYNANCNIGDIESLKNYEYTDFSKKTIPYIQAKFFCKDYAKNIKVGSNYFPDQY